MKKISINRRNFLGKAATAGASGIIGTSFITGSVIKIGMQKFII